MHASCLTLKNRHVLISVHNACMEVKCIRGGIHFIICFMPSYMPAGQEGGDWEREGMTFSRGFLLDTWAGVATGHEFWGGSAPTWRVSSVRPRNAA